MAVVEVWFTYAIEIIGHAHYTTIQKRAAVTCQYIRGSMDRLADNGLLKGDIVMVHSSFKSINIKGFSPLDLIKELKKAVGEDGVILTPSFTFNVCDEYNATGVGYFDKDSDIPCTMSVVSSVLNRQPGSYRTDDPIYSVVMSRFDTRLYPTGRDVFGFDSIFANLVNLRAKIMLIGVDYNSGLTIAHYVEELLDVPYRYRKEFKIQVKQPNGSYDLQTWTFRVRNKGITSELNRIGELMEKKGIVKLSKLGDAVIRVFNAYEVAKFIKEQYLIDNTILYKKVSE